MGVEIFQPEALGRRIRCDRKEKGMTQDGLSEKVGISLSFMGHIERGTRILSLETLIRISIALDASIDELLQDSLVHIVQERRKFENDLYEDIQGVLEKYKSGQES